MERWDLPWKIVTSPRHPATTGIKESGIKKICILIREKFSEKTTHLDFLLDPDHLALRKRPVKRTL